MITKAVMPNTGKYEIFLLAKDIHTKPNRSTPSWRTVSVAWNLLQNIKITCLLRFLVAIFATSMLGITTYVWLVAKKALLDVRRARNLSISKMCADISEFLGY